MMIQVKGDALKTKIIIDSTPIIVVYLCVVQSRLVVRVISGRRGKHMRSCYCGSDHGAFAYRGKLRVCE